MARAKASGTAPCVHCGGTSLRKNGHKSGHQRWSCPECGKSFTETYGTPMYRLRTDPQEVARALLIVMRRGSLSAAEEITGHKYETIGEWLRRAAAHAEALTRVLVHDLQLSEVEVDAFWSFVKKSAERLRESPPRRPNWTRTLLLEEPLEESAGAA